MPKPMNVCACDESNAYRELLVEVYKLNPRVRGRTRLPTELKEHIEKALAVRDLYEGGSEGILRRKRAADRTYDAFIRERDSHSCVAHPEQCGRFHPA